AAKVKACDLLDYRYDCYENAAYTAPVSEQIDNVAGLIQEVSDAAREVYEHFSIPGQHDVRVGPLTPFILPEPVDLLEEAVSDVWPHVTKPTAAEVTNALRAALSK